MSAPIESQIGDAKHPVSLLESISSGFSLPRAADLSNARSIALSAAKKERSDLLLELTGKTKDEFLEGHKPDPSFIFDPGEGTLTEKVEEFAFASAREGLPDDVKSKLFVGKDLERRANEIALERFLAAEDVSRRGASFGNQAAFFIGQLGGFATDPVNIGAMFAGSPWAAAVARGAIGRSLATRVMRSAAAEATIGATAETLIQPFVQAYRAELGLPNGFDIALQNIAFGALIGGGFGAAGIAGRNLYKQARGDIFDGIELPHALAERIRTDTGKSLSELSRKELIDEFIRLVDEPTPNELAAIRVLREREGFETVNPFPGRKGKERHVDEFMRAQEDLQSGRPVNPKQTPSGAEPPRGTVRPERITVQGPRPQAFVDWIKQQGGIKPSGELTQIGADKLAGVVSRNGLSLDEIRARAVEAGFLRDRGVQTVTDSTEDDFLDLLTRSASGERVVREGDIDLESQFVQADEINRLNEDLFAFEPEIRKSLRNFDQEEAYDNLTLEERTEMLFRATRQGEDPVDVIEDLAIQSELGASPKLNEEVSEQLAAQKLTNQGEPVPNVLTGQIRELASLLASGPSHTTRATFISDVYQAWVNLDRIQPILNASRNIDPDLKAEAADVARRILPDDVGVRVADQIEKDVGVRFSLPGFRSPTIDALQNRIPMKNGTAQQWMNQLRKSPNVKKDELDAIGLEDWLKQQKGKISKSDVLSFVEAHQVKLDERVLGSGATEPEIFPNGAEFIEFDKSELSALGIELYLDNVSSARRITALSGDAYIVVHLKSDNRIIIFQPFEDTFIRFREVSSLDQARHVIEGLVRVTNPDLVNEARFSEYSIPGGENYTELLIRLPELEDIGFESKHFNDQEIVHVRFDTRQGPNGEKVLFINEIQSDLQQDARRFGALSREEHVEIDTQRAALNKEFDKQIIRRGEAVEVVNTLTIDDIKPMDRNNLKLSTDDIPKDQRLVGVSRAYDYVMPHGFSTYRLYENTSLNHIDVRSSNRANAGRFKTIDEALRGAVLFELQNGDTLSRTFAKQNVLHIRDESLAKRQAVEVYIDTVSQQDNISNTLRNLDQRSTRPPEAPFKGDLWLELALKRMIKYANDNNFDAISWARSDQIANAVGGDVKALAVQYDQRIPGFLKKYTKKFGGKVEQADIPDLALGRDIEGNIIDETGAKFTNGIVRITPKMREITEQPLFSLNKEGQPEGSFDPTVNMVNIARAATDPERIIRHEAVHALRQSGLFTDAEWSLLERSARELDWLTKHNVKERYNEIYNQKANAPPFQEFMFEEAIADEFSLWVKGQTKVTDKIRQIFEKIRKFLENVGINIRGEGLETFEDVFQRIESGEIAARGVRKVDKDALAQIQDIIDRSVQGSQLGGGQGRLSLKAFKAQLVDMHQRGEIELAHALTVPRDRLQRQRLLNSEVEIAGDVFHTVLPTGVQGQRLKRRKRFSSYHNLSALTTDDNHFAPTGSFDRPDGDGPRLQLENEIESFTRLGDEDFDVIFGDEGAFETFKLGDLSRQVQKTIDHLDAMELCKS